MKPLSPEKQDNKHVAVMARIVRVLVGFHTCQICIILSIYELNSVDVERLNAGLGIQMENVYLFYQEVPLRSRSV